MNPIISQAVAAHTIVSFTYDGIPRLVEAHAYGVHKGTESEILVGFQLGGSKKLGDLAGWKVYKTSEIDGFRPSDARFSRKPKDPNFLTTQMAQTFAHAWTQKTLTA